MFAQYRGGPLDGDKHRRVTNRFSQFRSDTGGVMGYRGQVRHWTKPVDAGLQPTSGYILCSNVNSRDELVTEYWHCTQFFRLQEERDRWLYENSDHPDRDLVDRIGEWDYCWEMLGAYPEVNIKTLGLSPKYAADLLSIFEGCFPGDGGPMENALGEDEKQELAEVIAEKLKLDPKRLERLATSVESPQLSAGQASKLKVVQEKAPELAEEVESGKRTVADAYHALVERDIADRAAK